MSSGGQKEECLVGHRVFESSEGGRENGTVTRSGDVAPGFAFHYGGNKVGEPRQRLYLRFR